MLQQERIVVEVLDDPRARRHTLSIHEPQLADQGAISGVDVARLRRARRNIHDEKLRVGQQHNTYKHNDKFRVACLHIFLRGGDCHEGSLSQSAPTLFTSDHKSQMPGVKWRPFISDGSPWHRETTVAKDAVAQPVLKRDAGHPLRG